jgi:DNA-directed RNA polymerase specialized sigma24 family protein
MKYCRLLTVEPILSLDELRGLGFEPWIEDRLPENMADEISRGIFSCIRPGPERACVILRAEDFTYKEIGEILGLTEQEVARTFYRVRVKLKSKEFDINGIK